MHTAGDAEIWFIQEALQEARQALGEGEVPVGCVFVRDGMIIARSRNSVNATRNATRHAELNCIDQVIARCLPSGTDEKKINLTNIIENSGKKCTTTFSSSGDVNHLPQNKENSAEISWKVDFWKEVKVFVTVEPCAMCMDALGQLGVGAVTFGCSNDRFGGCSSVVDVPRLYKYKINIKRGVCKDEAVQLLKLFYQGENPNAPFGKAKRKRSQ